MPFLAIAIGVALALAIGGASLLFTGLVGTVRTDQPRCRRCGHDLRSFGAVPTTCEACQADLRGPGAVRFGPRVRSRRLVAVGGGTAFTAATAAVLLLAWSGKPAPAPATPAPVVRGAMPSRGMLTFSPASRPHLQPALLSARVLPMREGCSIEIILEGASRPDSVRLTEAGLMLGDERLVGRVRSVAARDSMTRPVLVVVIDFPPQAGVPIEETTRAVRNATLLELRAGEVGAPMTSWTYGEPFVRGTSGAAGEARTP